MFQIFIAIQAVAPFAGLLLTHPKKVERTDGVTVSCSIEKEESSWKEFVSTAKLFISKDFVLIIPLICQAVFAEAVYFTFSGLWFTVRARALGSFLGGIAAIAGGNILGLFLDRQALAVKLRARGSFALIMTLQAAWWIWGVVLVTEYAKTRPTLDWVDQGFGRAFAWFLLMTMSFQINYMYLYFVIGNLAKNDAEVIRYAGLLRGTESASQAVSYGLVSVKTMGEFGCVYMNFAMWAISIIPAWFVIRKIGVSIGKAID